MSTATPFLYCYGVGGVVFLVGLYFAWRHGYIDASLRGLRNLAVCLFVVTFFLTIQGYLQFGPMEEAPAGTYEGGAESVVERGGGIRRKWQSVTRQSSS